MTIFFTLNAMGVIFLVYVLAHFWMEGHRPDHRARQSAEEIRESNWATVAVITHLISHSAQGGLSVIPFRPMDRYMRKPARRVSTGQRAEAPVKRFSTK